MLAACLLITHAHPKDRWTGKLVETRLKESGDFPSGFPQTLKQFGMFRKRSCLTATNRRLITVDWGKYELPTQLRYTLESGEIIQKLDAHAQERITSLEKEMRLKTRACLCKTQQSSLKIQWPTMNDAIMPRASTALETLSHHSILWSFCLATN